MKPVLIFCVLILCSCAKPYDWQADNPITPKPVVQLSPADQMKEYYEREGRRKTTNVIWNSIPLSSIFDRVMTKAQEAVDNANNEYAKKKYPKRTVVYVGTSN